MTLISTPLSLNTTAPVVVVSESVVEPLEACDVCEHPMSEHDPISLRYCKATLSSALSRHCICPTGGV